MRPSCTLVLLLALAPLAQAQEAPPRRLDFSNDSLATERMAQPTSRAVRNAFVRDQTILGLLVYGPAFSAMFDDEGAKAAAGYLVMAGGTFFAAAEVTRRMEMTEAQQMLATRMAWRSALGALYVASAPNEHVDGSTKGAVTLLGGIGGTVAGLMVGKGLTPGEATATAFGHDFVFASAGLIAYAADPETGDDRGLEPQARALILTGSGIAGYVLGRHYAGNAPYNVTAGDVSALWLGAAIGATAAGAAIVESEPEDPAVALTLLGGGLAGAFVADRFLVRRYDHSRSEGRMLFLGGTAGGLMGVGIGVLVAGEAEREGAATLGFAALGAIGGVLLTERFLMPTGDEGRQFGLLERLRLEPAGLLAAASGMRGHHALARFTF